MLGKQLDPGQIFSHDSDSSASDSELDCSGLISQSDNEANSSQADSHTFKNTLKNCHGKRHTLHQ